MDYYFILGRENKISQKDLIEKISVILDENKKKFIVTANPEGVIIGAKDKDFRDIVNGADFVTADGIGILWAATFLNYKAAKNFIKYLEIPFLALVSLFFLVIRPSSVKKIIPERVAGSDLFWEMIKLAKENSKSIFLLGGQEGIAEEASKVIKEKYPQINIAGFYAGFPKEIGIVERINNNNTNILFVAWGQPKQEKWIKENLKDLNINLAIGVGGTFDFVVGKVRRSPIILQKMGLEWLWRLIKEPKRIKRIFIAVPKFIYTVINYKLKH